MRDLGEVVRRSRGDEEVRQHDGDVGPEGDASCAASEVPGAPLEIRWSLRAGDNWAITATALTSKLWLIRQDKAGEWQAKEVATIGDPAKIPLPVDISIIRGRQGPVGQYVHGRHDPLLRSDRSRAAPVQTYAKQTRQSQVNMVSQSWDGKRVYITSSLLAKWDKKGADDEQFLRAFNWDGKELKLAFETDFKAESSADPIT